MPFMSRFYDVAQKCPKRSEFDGFQPFSNHNCYIRHLSGGIIAFVIFEKNSGSSSHGLNRLPRLGWRGFWSFLVRVRSRSDHLAVQRRDWDCAR